MKKTYLLIIFVVFVLGIGSLIANRNENNQEDNPPPPPGRACTQEAKICPDGTAVGRQGENCGFTPCPGEQPTKP